MDATLPTVLVTFVAELTGVLVQLLPYAQGGTIPTLCDPVGKCRATIVVGCISRVHVASTSVTPGADHEVNQYGAEAAAVDIGITIVRAICGYTTLHATLSLSLHPEC